MGPAPGRLVSRRSRLQAVTGSSLAIVAAAVAVAIGAAGYLVPVQHAGPAPAAVPVRGSTSSVCTTGTLSAGGQSDSSESQVYAATTQAKNGATGTLTGRSLGDGDSGAPLLSIDQQGQSKIIDSPKGSMVLVADGVLAGASAGMVYGSTESGEDRGLSLAPCTYPVVDQWFTGLGATNASRSELVLTNTDDRQAEVDLEFFGPRGLINIPGASDMIIPADSSQTLSLEDLLGNVDGDISVQIKASVGRVAAIARDLTADAKDLPTGVDWHPASAAPSGTQIIPAIPGGDGSRRLIIFNPGQRRADAKIQILGPDGPFAPAGAATVSVDAGSSVSVNVTGGLGKTTGAIRVVSDQPVVSAVQSVRPAIRTATNRPEKNGLEKNGLSKNGLAKVLAGNGASDIAIDTAQTPITGLGIAPAAVIAGARTELEISNGGGKTSDADVTLYNTAGVSIDHQRIAVPPGGSVARPVSQAGAAYLVVRTPNGSALYGGITMQQTSGKVSGLAASALVTPALAGQGRTPVQDPRVGQ